MTNDKKELDYGFCDKILSADRKFPATQHLTHPFGFFEIFLIFFRH